MPKTEMLENRGTVYVTRENFSHIWIVTYDIKSNVFTINNLNTRKKHYLSPAEFVYNSAMWNSIVDKFPNYVHRQVWVVHARYFRG